MFSIGHSTNTLPRAETHARQKKVKWRRKDGHGAFAECPGFDTWQRSHVLPSAQALTLGKYALVCRVSRHWHSANMAALPSIKSWTLGKHDYFYRVLNPGHSAKTDPECTDVGFFAECHSADTRQRSHFSPRMYRFWPRVLFAECFYLNTRQKSSLPSVHLAKRLYISSFYGSGTYNVPHSNKHYMHYT